MSAKLATTPALGLQPCLAGRADGALAALLDDGTVAILSIDGDGATTHEVVRLEGGGAQAVACSADGALLAVASASALGVYELVADGAGRWRARLRWRAQLRAHARALALASSASAGVAVAVGGAPGLLLFGDAAAAAAAPTASAGEQREGVLLHRGAVVVCCSFCASAERLAVATLDGRLLVHRAAAAGWQRGPPALIWSARLPCERACSLSWAADGRWIAVASWQADVALYDAAEYAADGAPPPLGAGATVGAAATAARRRAQEWRLATVRAPQQPQPAGPVVLVWAAAPHAAGTLVCAQPAAPAAPAQSGAAAPRQRLEAWRAAVDGSPLPGFAPLPAGAQLRGLCSGRAGTSERLCWLDAEGVLRWRSLWAWEAAGSDAAQGAADDDALLPPAEDGGPPRLRLAGEVCELPAASADACIDAWRGGAPAVWPRLATGVAHAAVLHRRLVQVRPRGGDGGVRWHSLLLMADLLAACIVGDHTLLLLLRDGLHAHRLDAAAAAPLAAAGTIDAAALAAALDDGAALVGAELVADARDGRRFVLLARDAPPASAAYRVLLGDAPPGGAPALREPAATPLVAPWGGGGAPTAVVAADGARLLFRRDADGAATWIECDLARGSFAAAKYRGSSAAPAVREFLGR